MRTANNGQIVTVFGGTGFVGRYVVWRLARLGYIIRIPTRNRNHVVPLMTSGTVGQITPVLTSLTNEASVERAIEGADYVINLIGILFERGRQRFDTLQAELPGVIGRLAQKHGVRQIVHMSALGADIASKSNYARTKAEGERAVRGAFPSAVIMRPSVIFGAEDNFINRFAKMARLLPVLPLVGRDTRFQPVYVGDVADAIVAALTAEDAAGQVFELGGPEILSFEQIIDFIFTNTRQRRPLFVIPFEVAFVQAWFFEKLPLIAPPLTRDQVRMLQKDNVVSGGQPGLPALGIAPKALEAIMPKFLFRFRAGGRFAQKYGAA